MKPQDAVSGDTASRMSSSPEQTLVAAPPKNALRLHHSKTSLSKGKRDETAVLQYLENQIYEENLRNVLAASMFAEIEPDAKVPPLEWVKQHGQKEANRMFRIAKGAWMNAKEAPVGLAISKSIVTGFAKARAVERSGGKNLNMVVAVEITQNNYERVEVLSDD